MSSLEVLVAQHRQKLTELYTLISPQPTELVTAQLDALQALLGATIEQQRLCAENERDQIQASLDKSWEKVALWRTALGEDASIGKGRGTGPLKTSVQEVEEVLQSMRGRMEERGKQILGLNSRIATFVPSLGKEWLQVSLDEVEQGWEALDLRLERMSALEREVMRCETEIARRRDAINANVNEIFALRSELGIHQGDGTTSDDFDEAILAHLGIGESRERKELEPTSENIARAEAKRKWLEDEKNQRNMTIQTTYDKLYPLWTMLGVSEYEMEQFVNTHMGSTQDVVMAVSVLDALVPGSQSWRAYSDITDCPRLQYQDELARMLTLKRSNLSAFIQRERVALSNLWDALYLSMPQRIASFPPLQVCIDSTRVWNEVTGAEEEIINNNVSEELLVAHERERERVEAEVERCQPVLERLGKYFSVVEEMAQLEVRHDFLVSFALPACTKTKRTHSLQASASDPSRLLGKSTRGDPGRLLREEKARKRVVKEKPRLEAELRQFIPAWEQQNQRPFLVNGVRFLDDLENKMGAEMAEKENKKREKMGTKSTATTRPLQSQMTGASSVGPLKRQMTGRSATGTSTTGGPAAKRQTPMATGGVPRAVAVVDHASQHYQQAAAHPMVVGGSTKLVPQMTGMKLPSGWGAPAAVAAPEQYGYQPTAQYGMAPQTQYSMPPLRAQPTGGFRPGPRA